MVNVIEQVRAIDHELDKHENKNRGNRIEPDEKLKEADLEKLESSVRSEAVLSKGQGQDVRPRTSSPLINADKKKLKKRASTAMVRKQRRTSVVAFMNKNTKDEHKVSIESLKRRLEGCGLFEDQSKVLKKELDLLSHQKMDSSGMFPVDNIIKENHGLVHAAMTDNLVLPKFEEFTESLRDLIEEIRHQDSGKTADYIPELAAADPNTLAVSVCTVDGQVFNYGKVDTKFSIQSGVKPFAYAQACEEHGVDVVHNYVGIEASGLSFNEVSLNSENKPHNPLINAGAIMTTALISPHKEPSARLSKFMHFLQRMAGDQKLGFEQAVYLSEFKTAYRNQALTYFMQSVDGFPTGSSPEQALDTYLQCCSLSVDVEACAKMAATLANGGICPLTKERCVRPEVVQTTLALMFTCGMYDYSGEWARTVGMPAKSGVSGVVYVVIPGLMGISIISPQLDKRGNSVRGIKFFTKLMERFHLNTFARLVQGRSYCLSEGLSAKDAVSEREHKRAKARQELVHTFSKFGKLMKIFKKHAQNGKISRATLEKFAEKGSLRSKKNHMKEQIGVVCAKNDGFGASFVDLFLKNCNYNLVIQSMLEGLAVPSMREMKMDLQIIYDHCKENCEGTVPSEFPELLRLCTPDCFAVSICTVDGQQMNIGEAGKIFPLTSLAKTLLYIISMQENGSTATHSRVSNEMTSMDPTLFTLNGDGIPHNPFTDAGALCVSSLVKPEMDNGLRFTEMLNFFNKITGNQKNNFGQTSYLSQKETLIKRRALASYLQGMGCLGSGDEQRDAGQVFDVYLQACSLESNTERLAVLAATLANKGVNPLTQEELLNEDLLPEILSIMYTCGMNRFGGTWNFHVGIPAVYGTGGSMLAVIPGVMGISIFSPRLNNYGVSSRASEFLMHIAHQFQLSIFQQLVQKMKGVERGHSRPDVGDPELQHKSKLEKSVVSMNFQTFNLIQSASTGSTGSIRKLIRDGCDVLAPDYDGRTALHLSCSEGHVDCTELLLENGADPFINDRWGCSPIQDCWEKGHIDCINVIRKKVGPESMRKEIERGRSQSLLRSRNDSQNNLTDFGKKLSFSNLENISSQIEHNHIHNH